MIPADHQGCIGRIYIFKPDLPEDVFLLNGAVEADRKIVFPITLGHPVGIDLFDKYPFGPAQHLLHIAQPVLLGNQTDHFASAGFDPLFYLLLHAVGTGPFSSGIPEGMDVTETGILHNPDGLHKIFLRFPREPHDHIGREIKIRHIFPERFKDLHK